MLDIRQGDAVELLQTLPDNSVDLIATDPPYFKVKKEAWDRAWAKPVDFLAWLDTVLAEFQRVLKPNGSLYLFASPQMSARVEVLIAERFNVLNSITWRKIYPHYGAGGPDSPARCSPPALREFYDQTERIIFAEHPGADNIAKGEAGYGAKCDELRGFVFEPLRAYLEAEMLKAGWTKSALKKQWMLETNTKSEMPRHWFERKQFELPTPKNYRWLKGHLGAGFLQRPYEHLRLEYEHLRRPFYATPDAPYTDVWTFKTVKPYPGKHPCEKPLALLSHIIKTSSRPNAVVLDAFMGSGSTGEAALSLGRNFIGFDLDEHWVRFARSRCERALSQGELFANAAD